MKASSYAAVVLLATVGAITIGACSSESAAVAEAKAEVEAAKAAQAEAEADLLKIRAEWDLARIKPSIPVPAEPEPPVVRIKPFPTHMELLAYAYAPEPHRRAESFSFTGPGYVEWKISILAGGNSRKSELLATLIPAAAGESWYPDRPVRPIANSGTIFFQFPTLPSRSGLVFATGLIQADANRSFMGYRKLPITLPVDYGFPGGGVSGQGEVVLKEGESKEVLRVGSGGSSPDLVLTARHLPDTEVEKHLKTSKND